MNQPVYPPTERVPHPGRDPGPDPPTTGPPGRLLSTWLVVAVVVAFVLIGTAFVLLGGGADPIEEVAVDDVTEGGAAMASGGDETVSLTGEVDEILTESALTVTGGGSGGPLLVLLTPATIVNGTATTLGGQPGGIAGVVPPEGTVQLVGTVDTFDSDALAERLGIVLNDELFAPWQGEPVLIAGQVETFDPDADPATTSLASDPAAP